MKKKVDNSRNVLLHCESKTVMVNLDKLIRSKVTLIDICKIFKEDSVVKVSKLFEPIRDHDALTDSKKGAVVSKRKTKSGTKKENIVKAKDSNNTTNRTKNGTKEENIAKVKDSKNTKNHSSVSNKKKTSTELERFMNDNDRKEINFASEINESKSNVFDKIHIKNTEKTEHLEEKSVKVLVNNNKKETSDISVEKKSWSRLPKPSEFEPVEFQEHGLISAQDMKSLKFVNAKFVVKNRLGFHSEKLLNRGSFEDRFRKKLMQADIKKLTESLDQKFVDLSSEDDIDLSSEVNLDTDDGNDNVNDGKKSSVDGTYIKPGKENLERIMTRLLRLLNSLKNNDLLIGCWNKVMPSVRSPTRSRCSLSSMSSVRSPTRSRCSLPSMPSLEEKVERKTPHQRKFVTANLDNRIPNKQEDLRAANTLSELKDTFYTTKKGFKIPKIQKVKIGQKGAKLWVQGLTVDETGTYEVNENGKRILTKSGKMLKSRAITNYALLDDWKDISGSRGLNLNPKELNEKNYPEPESLKDFLFISSPRKLAENSGELPNLISFKNCLHEMLANKSEDIIDDTDWMEKDGTKPMNALPQEGNRLLNVNAQPGTVEDLSHVTTLTSVSIFGPLVSNWIAKKKYPSLTS